MPEGEARVPITPLYVNKNKECNKEDQHPLCKRMKDKEHYCFIKSMSCTMHSVTKSHKKKVVYHYCAGIYTTAVR